MESLLPTNQPDYDEQPGAPSVDARVEQLLALNRAAVAITGELELDSLLQCIIDVARELVACKYVALGVLGDDGFIERFPTSGISETERELIGELPRGHGLLGVMLRAGHSLRIPDMSKDERGVGFPPNHPPMTSLLGVPIFVRGKLMGDLYLTDKIASSEFSEADEWIVQLLATHAATALANAGLHAEKVQALELAGRERARADALFKVSQAINRSMHLDEVIQLIVRSATELLDAAGAAVYLLEDADDARSMGKASGSIEDMPQEPRVHFVARYAFGLEQLFTVEASQLPFDTSLAGRAVKTGLTQVLDDVRDAPELVLPKLADKSLQSLAAIPLDVGDGNSQRRKIVGVLSAYSDRVAAFDETAVRLLEVFAAVASTAIYNARLFEEAQRGREAAEREQDRLRELEQMKDEFLSTAAHELRTPLTTIRMSSGLALEQVEQMAAQNAIDPRIVSLISLVVDGSLRMHSLVNDLLDLTRLEQGRAVFTFDSLDLREVVTASVDAVGALFESKHQRLDVRIPEFRCLVRGDKPRLEQVVINLLSNANKYSPPDTQLEVRVLQHADECQVIVRDAGPGVPEEERELIFERFYRSSIHRNDRTASTGLGLPIARKIAEMHRGRVWVAPAPGGGSIFTLALPSAAVL